MKRMIFVYFLVVLLCALIYPGVSAKTHMPDSQQYTNSLQMKFVRIDAGSFKMGQIDKPLPPEVLPLIEGGDRGGRFDLLANADYDEKPIHQVQISRPFYMGTIEVTNKQYELFDPDHRRFRNKHDLSKDDNEAVIYVNWYDAMAFCEWLSHSENLPYRLPTEAEWEYACRAGTTSNYYTGDILPSEYEKTPSRGCLVKADLHAGQTPANQWGLFDMHGNVEEWCMDWYGPYVRGKQRDPIGYIDGAFKVSRGGSFGTFSYYLRSANRMATLPEERQWATGFRVVIGLLPRTRPLIRKDKPLHQQNVIQRKPKQVELGPEADIPYFHGPRKFVIIDREAIGPVFAGHNHSPFIISCPNGDLLATWFTCVSEKDREMARAGSRLRWGNDQWDRADVFWDVPDRNDSVAALWFDGTDTLYNLMGIDVGSTYSYHSLGLRTSKDSGASWSKVRIFNPEHVSPKGLWGGHMLSGPVFRTNDGGIAAVTDGYPTLWISSDEALTWKSCEGNIQGNHPGVMQLKDSSLLGFIRDGEVEGPIIATEYYDLGKKKVHRTRQWWMAKCISNDMGKTWVKTPSIFPGIGGGQRLVLIRLKEGPIFFASFADRGIIITDKSGAKREVRGLFAAVSKDEGKTWSNVKLVSDEGLGKPAMTTNGGFFAMSQRNAEYRGYLAVTQAANGLIHLISSYSHYTFNLAWLMAPAEPLKYEPIKVRKFVETFDGPDFADDNWEPYHGHAGGFTGKGAYRIISRSHFQGMNRLIGEGSFKMEIVFENIRFNPRGDTASPGITIWIKDAMMRRLHFYIRDDRISLGLADEEEAKPFPDEQENEVRYEVPPKSARLKFTYDDSNQRVRIYYGLNGEQAIHELGHSVEGVYFGKVLSESTAVYIMFSNGQVDVDHFSIKPLE